MRISSLILFLFLYSMPVLSEPNVLKCNENCGQPDLENEFSFQAKIAMGEDLWGANVTFIEDDIILSQGHILGYYPEDKGSIPRCGADASTNPAADWKNHKNDMYVVSGKEFPKKIIIGKVIDISMRVTGVPPGYDIMIALVDRNCKKCNTSIPIKPIPVATQIPKINSKARHVFIPEEDLPEQGKGVLSDRHLLNGRIWGSRDNSCTRQIIKHDGKSNPPMIFGTSGSPVIIKECGSWAVHGLHGNGMDFDGYMYESLQLLQTQKQWIQSEIHRWTGRKDMQDACSQNGRKSFMIGEKFEIKQLGCGKTIFEPDEPVSCKLINQSNVIDFPNF